MKKKWLSGLVILITAILITYMVINNKKADSDYTMVENTTEKTDIKNGNLDDFLDNVESKDEMLKEEKQEIESNNIRENDVKEEDNIGEINNTNEKKQEIEIEDSPIIEEVKEETIAVFKVDKNLIVNSLSFREKKSLVKIVSSLSMNDYALIMDSVKNDGELECVTQVNQILKERLGEEEYSLIKEILEPYIYLDIL
ncbi:MAG: hypothetical protein ACRCWG_01200 [Sarcina sp.]